MKYEPMRHQKIAFDFCMSHPHAGLFVGMGLGKTVVSLSALAERLFHDHSVKKALVIAPKNVAENVWAQECRKWDHTQGIRSSVLTGPAAKRRAALAADAHLYIINRENVVWLMDELGGTFPFEMVILDELSSFKSHQAKRWRALKKPIQQAPFVLGLTGTPAPNGYMDLWAEVFLLDGGAALGRNLGAYRARYFSPGASKGRVVYEWRLRVGAKAAIDRQIKNLCLSMSAEDWLALPKIIYNTIPVAMPAAARRNYEQLKQEKVIPLLKQAGGYQKLNPFDEEDLAKMTSAIQGQTAAAIAGKLLQMANGAVYDDAGNVIQIHDQKLDALEEVMDTNPGESLLVFYNFKHDKDRILSRFPSARAFSGSQDVEDWNAGKIPLLLCHPASTGHGLNLQQGGHIIVWYGLTWSLELYQQANARLPRPGQKQSVIIHHIVCKDTLDEGVLDALKEKNDTQDGLLQALRRYVAGA